MKTFWITMGQVHVHSIAGRTIDKDVVVEIFAEDYEAAQDWAFATFGQKFAVVYREKPDMSFFPRGIIKL